MSLFPRRRRFFMLTFFMEGGFPMFVILGLGLTALVLSMRAAFRPSTARFALVRGLARATLYSTLVGVFADLAAVFHNARKFESPDFDFPHIIVTGLGEAMSPLIMGFTILSLVSLFAGLCARRLAPAA
jgi:hypothetical protein